MQCVFEGLGKPDFATAGKLFYRLAPDIREGLNKSEERTLVWTIFLCWHQWFHGGRSALYASYSESWIGLKFGRSRWTVARAVVRLCASNLLQVTHRRPLSGERWQTNLYRFGSRLAAAFGAKSANSPNKSPCSKSAPEESLKREYKPAARSTSVAAAGRTKYGDPPLTPKDPRSETYEEFQARIRSNYSSRPHPDH